jgi:hypothetical protein
VHFIVVPLYDCMLSFHYRGVLAIHADVFPVTEQLSSWIHHVIGPVILHYLACCILDNGSTRCLSNALLVYLVDVLYSWSSEMTLTCNCSSTVEAARVVVEV